jgi:AraC-like DNA-binding protein
MEPVLYIGMAQSFFAGLMIATKKPQHVQDKVLAAWLFMITLEMGFALGKSYYNQLLAFTFIPFTYGPLLFLYTRFLIEEEPRFEWKSWLHFIPFIVFFILTFVYRKWDVLQISDFFERDRFFALRMIYSVSFIVSISTYSTLSFVLIKKHQKKLGDLYSYTSDKITLNWLKGVSISFSVTYLAMFIAGAFNIFNRTSSPDPLLFSYIGLTLFAFAFSIYGYKQPEIYKHYGLVELGPGKAGEPGKGNNGNGEGRYLRSGLKENEAKKYLKRLLKIMADEKPYLNGELSINDLTVRMGIPRHYLTQILNEKLGKNFYTFVNEYRVKEVIRMMKDPFYDNYTLLALGFEAGFNAKSSFNNIFKNFTGMTPSEYREKMRDDDRSQSTADR